MRILSEWEGRTSLLLVLKSDSCSFCTVNVYTYSVTFCIPYGTVAQARRSFSNPMKVFYMKLFVLMQPPSSKSTFAGGNSETDKLEKHEMECQKCCSSFLNSEPLTWRIVVKHKRLNKKQEGYEWEMLIYGLGNAIILDVCVLYCCLYPVCPIYKLFSLE